MKRIALIVLGLFAAISAEAQIVSSTSSITQKVADKDRFGYANIGLNIGGGGSKDINAKMGFEFNGGIEKRIQDTRFSIASEIGFTTCSFDDPFDDVIVENNTPSQQTRAVSERPTVSGNVNSIYVTPIKGIADLFSVGAAVFNANLGLYLSYETIGDGNNLDFGGCKYADVGVTFGVGCRLNDKFNIALNHRNGFRSGIGINYTSINLGMKFIQW